MPSSALQATYAQGREFLRLPTQALPTSTSQISSSRLELSELLNAARKVLFNRTSRSAIHLAGSRGPDS